MLPGKASDKAIELQVEVGSEVNETPKVAERYPTAYKDLNCACLGRLPASYVSDTGHVERLNIVLWADVPRSR